MRHLRRALASTLLAGSSACRSAAGVFIAIAAGLCDAAELTRHTQAAWDQADLHGRSHVLSGLTEWEKLFCKFVKPGGRIGLIGCGSGRDLIPLAQLGYHVDGVDSSPRAVRFAGQYLAEARVEGRVFLGDIVEFEFPHPWYDAFIFSDFAYAYIVRNHQRIGVLKALRSKLKPDGHIIVTFRPYSGEGQRAVRLARWVARVTRNPDRLSPGDFVSEDLSYERRFTRQAIGEEARAAQFEIIAYHEDADATLAVLKSSAVSL